MEPAPSFSLPSAERLSWEEIRRRYPDEWVMMVEVDWLSDDDPDFRTAAVVGHGKTRAEVSHSTREIMSGASGGACMFTGRLVPTGPICLSPHFAR